MFSILLCDGNYGLSKLAPVTNEDPLSRRPITAIMAAKLLMSQEAVNSKFKYYGGKTTAFMAEKLMVSQAVINSQVNDRWRPHIFKHNLNHGLPTAH